MAGAPDASSAALGRSGYPGRLARRALHGAALVARWRCISWALALGPAFLLAAPVPAQESRPCLVEVEPDDTPELAADGTGQACLTGAIGAGDQDLFGWRTAGPALWTFTLAGVAGNETRLDLIPLSGDPPAPGSRVFTMTAGTGPQQVLLPEGDWLLGLSTAGEGTGDWRLDLAGEPLALEGTPPPLSTDAPSLGLLPPGAPLALDLTISPALARRHLTLRIDTVPGTALGLTLDGPAGRMMERSVTVDGALVLPMLGLDAGSWTLGLTALSADPLPFRASLTPDRPRLPTREDEPNDTTEGARPLLPGKPVQGALDGPGDQDLYRLTVTPRLAGQLLSLSIAPPATLSAQDIAALDASSAGFSERLCLLDAAGAEVQCKSGTRATLGDLALAEGTYVAAITGPADPPLPYEIAFRPGPARAAGQEVEPNDTAETAQALAAGETVAGRYLGEETDRFALEVSGPAQLWRIEALDAWSLALEDPSGTQVAARSATDGSLTDLILDDLLLEPGRYTLALEGTDQSYRLTATPKGPPPPGLESEPNDTEAQANLLKPGTMRQGRLASPGDDDLLRFHLDAPARLDLRVTPGAEATILARLTGPGIALDQAISGAAFAFPPEFPAGDYLVALRTEDAAPAAWQVALDWRVEPASVPGLTGRADVAARAVASHLPFGQEVAGVLHLTSTLAAPVTLSAQAISPAPGIGLRAADLTLAPGSGDLPFVLRLPPDLRRDPALPVTLRLTGGPAPLDVGLRLPVLADAPAVAAVAVLPPPAPLQGSFNLASPAFGGHTPDGAAETLGLADPADLASLFDDLPGTGDLTLAPGQTVRVDFGPADPVPVAGIALLPGANLTDYAPSTLNGFDLALSVDGSRFTPVLSGTLGARPGEAWFALPAPVLARSAALTIRSGTGAQDQPVRLAEWKVLAQPGQPQGVRINLADPDRGGHVVRTDPMPNALPATLDDILRPGGDGLVVPGEGQPQLVLGFADTRRARIASLDWIEAPSPTGEGTAWGPVSVAAGPTPLGPWQDLGQMAPDGGGAAHLDLPGPVAARFLRLTRADPTPVQGRTDWLFPTEIRVMETEATAEAPSITGDWGMGSTLAGLDRDAVPLPEAEDEGEADSADAPRALAWGDTVAGRVTLGQDEDHWRFTPPEGVTRALVTLTGVPFVTAEVQVTGPDGAPLPLRPAPPLPGSRRYEAEVVAGQSYTVHVQEPPRSLVVAFDVSGSLGPYWPAIRAGLAAFAEGPVPGRDFLRFLPFDGTFDGPDWTDQPDVIRRGLMGFSAVTTGSGTEATVLTALRELAGREGQRALLLLTDGATSSFADRGRMWAALQGAGVDVMTAHVGGWDDPLRERQLLQDLAAEGAGFFAEVQDRAQIDALAERAVDWMRRPARYGLSVEASTLPPPAPALLAVAAPAPGAAELADSLSADALPADPVPEVAAGQPAVELIIDASGSMLQRLGSQGRRIDVAHRVLDALIRSRIPPGTPVALRAFGDDAAGSCATTLRAPLLPLVPEDLAPLATAIEPVNLAKTPIAASLAATSEDLAAAAGPRVVVLVTDGEETCGGDPEAEIAALRAQGVQVTVNIVGFAVDDSAVAATLAAWAAQGGGRYLPAGDEAGLAAAMDQAVLEGFAVRDATGKTVAEGQVGGDPVSLPAGVYQVDVGQGRVRFPAVTLNEGEARTLDLPGE